MRNLDNSKSSFVLRRTYVEKGLKLFSFLVLTVYCVFYFRLTVVLALIGLWKQIVCLLPKFASKWQIFLDRRSRKISINDGQREL